MRVSEKITIRRGQAYEIKGISGNGTMLLRPTVHVVLKLEEDPQTAKAEPIIIENSSEPREFALVPRRTPHDSPQGSCGLIGFRKGVEVRLGFNTERTKKFLARNQQARNRAKRRGVEDGYIGKTSSWKDCRSSQYRRCDKCHESDPNPVHLDL